MRLTLGFGTRAANRAKTNRQDSRFVQPQAAPKGCGTRMYRIKHLIGQQGGGLGHAACATAGAEPALLAGKRHQSLEVAFVAAHPEKAVLEAAALQVGLEYPVDMLGQGFALLGQLVNQGGVVRLDELVVSARVDGVRRRFYQGHPCLVPTWWFRLRDQEDRTNQPVSGGRIMPYPKWPVSLSRFIRCGRLPRGRRCKTLAAHVITVRKRVVTWAPRD